MKLNLRCGAQAPSGWINVDYALGARLMKIPFFRAFNRKIKLVYPDWDNKIYLHDLTKKFPWPDSSVDVIYNSHVLEHFSKDDGQKFLAECHRVLRKNGIIRVVVPDFQHIVSEYIEGRIHSDNFIQSLGVLYGNKKNKLLEILSPLFEFPHKCLYDNSRLIYILNEIGFNVSAKFAFDSNIDDISMIELESRTRYAVIVEGYKR